MRSQKFLPVPSWGAIALGIGLAVCIAVVLARVASAGPSDAIFGDRFEFDGYTIGGTVSGLQGDGLALRLAGGDTLAIEVDGPFVFASTVDDGQSYAVSIEQQPSNPHQLCTIDNGSGTVAGSAVDDVQVLCPAVPPPLPTGPGGSFAVAIKFLYTGPTAPQTGVDPGALAPDRVGVLYGRVLDGDGVPLEGAVLTVLDHPEFGQTLSAADGAYAMAVNGGSELVVDATFPGLLPSQRRVAVPWNAYVPVPDMALVALDAVATPVQADAGQAQLAVASTISDDRGIRTARMLFPAGTDLQMTMPDGSVTPLADMVFRITEYTVGPNGPARMPGLLPATSAYTYAVELSSDEAIAAEAVSVELDQFAWLYIDNFLDFPVGEVVPNGYYDRQQGLWLPSDNGRVLEVVGIDGDAALLDIDGDGLPDTGAALDALGVNSEELERLATTFVVGASFWRIPIRHFTPHDPNWPYVFPPESEQPPEDEPEPDETDPCNRPGSVIECPTRVLGETIELAGSDVHLHYRSDRVPGFTRALTADIEVTGDSLPSAVPVRAELVTEIAGQRQVFEYSPVVPDISERFTWDRRDLFDRLQQGRHTLVTETRYYYDVLYAGASGTSGQAFGAPGNGNVLGTSGVQASLDTRSVQTLGLWDARGAGLGGWTLGQHHALDPTHGLLYEGTGNQRQLPPHSVATSIAPTPSIYHISVAPDGSILANGNSSNTLIKRIYPDGSESTIAGGGTISCTVTPLSGSGDSQFEGIRPTMMLEMTDGTVVFTETMCNRISRLELDGSWSPVAGTGTSGYAGDGGPATAAELFMPRGLALGSDGALIFSDWANHAVRRVGPDGIIETIAGGNGLGYSGDGGLATAAQLRSPGYLAVGPDGSIYVVDQGTQSGAATATTRGTRIRRIAPDGIIYTIAGDGTSGGVSSRPVESGVPATSTGIDAEAIVVSPRGEIFFNEVINHIVRRISPDGTITTFAGIPGLPGNAGDGGPAVAANFLTPAGLALAPDGRLLVNDRGNARIREIRPDGIPRDANGQYLVASTDGREVHVFDGAGVHLRTDDGFTGIPLRTFHYDSAARLARIEDPDGTVLDIARPDPETVLLTSQTGESTTLTMDAEGWLAAVSFAGGESRTLSHATDGLLMRLGDFRGNDSEFTYDTLGRLATDENRLQHTATLVDAPGPGLAMSLTDFNGGVTSFATIPGSDGSRLFERVSSYGGVTSTLESASGLVSIAFEDGVLSEAMLVPDPRFGMAVPYVANRSVAMPSGLTLEAGNLVEATLDGGDPRNLAAMTVTATFDGHETVTEWDGPTRELTTTTAEGMVTTATYDVRARLVAYREDPAFSPAGLVYDAEGRLAQVTRGSGVVTQTFDGQGRLAGIGNNAGMDVTFGHDANGRVTSVTSTLGHIIGLDHDDEGRITSITLPSTAEHLLGYHPTGQLAGYTAPGSAPTLFGARNDGSLASVTLPGGRIATRTFDGGLRPTGWVTPESTILASHVGNTSHVDVTTWTPAVGAPQSLDLDWDGALLTRMTWSGVSNAEVELGYGSDFQLVSTTLNGGTPRLHSRDGDGRIVADGPFNWIRANPRRAMSSITDGTMLLEQTLDELGLLATRTLTVDGSVVHELALSYREDRRIDTVIETLGGTADDRSYVYDGDNRLTQVLNGIFTLEHYDYDGNLNRTLVDLGVPRLQTYDVQDRLTSIDGIAVTVDDDGQTTAIGGDTFVHGTRGELLELTAGGSTVTFTYDGYGRRAARTEAGETTAYVYGDPLREGVVTAVREPDGTWLSYYYDETGKLYAVDRAGTWYYVGTDHLGSPRVVADAGGAVVKVVDYSAFGEVLGDSNPALELHIGFAGGLREPAGQTLRFGQRDYHPRIGRWLTRDPLLFRGGSPNLYAYVRNDPVNLFDRHGLWPSWTVPAGSVGGGYHAGFGGKLEFSSDGAGTYGFCIGVGVGAGYSFSIDPGGRPQTYFGVDGSVGVKIPGTPLDAGGDTAVRWHKCPPGSARPGYWEFVPLTPSVTAGPVSLGSDGVKVGGGGDAGDLGGVGGGMSSNANFTACADI